MSDMLFCHRDLTTNIVTLDSRHSSNSDSSSSISQTDDWYNEDITVLYFSYTFIEYI